MFIEPSMHTDFFLPKPICRCMWASPKQEDFIPEVSEWAGAATYLTSAKGADITLFI